MLKPLEPREAFRYGRHLHDYRNYGHHSHRELRNNDGSRADCQERNRDNSGRDCHSNLTGAFTVQGATLSSISPTSSVRGTSVNVTLTGTNLTGATAVTAPGSPNITVTNFLVVNDSKVTATLNIAPGTTLGSHNITVTTSGGRTNPVTFQVTGATVTFAGPTPVLTTTPGNTITKTGTITVTNTATGPTAGPFTFTTGPAISKVGTVGGTFSITGGTCANGTVLNAGGACTIIVQYVPGTSGTATANVSVTGTGLATASQTGANFTAN